LAAFSPGAVKPVFIKIHLVKIVIHW